MRYRLIRRLHLILSLVLTGPLLVLSLSGALLVYGPELQRLVSPEGWTVTPSSSPLSPARVLDRVAADRPDLKIWSLSLAQRPDHPHTAWLAGGAGVLNIDPADGRILVHYRPQETLQGWLTALHRRWLAEGDTARWTRNIISGIALALVVQLGIGLWLWLKPPSPLRRLKIPRGQGWRIAVLRGHQLTGIATALLLLLVALTGMAMYWTGPMKALVETATLGQVQQPEPGPMTGLAPLSDLDAAITLAQAEVPAARLRHFRPPDKPGAPAIFAFFEPGQAVPSRIWVGDAPVRVLHSFDGTDINAATWIWHQRYPLHIGDFAGPLVRAFWVLIALAPAGFALTGLWLHWGRRQRERRGKSRGAWAGASPG